MSGHCGYKGEVEALIHCAAEVNNKCVIEKGLRGRTTSGETSSEIKPRAKGSLRAGRLNHPLN